MKLTEKFNSICEMSNLVKSDTNLSRIVWVAVKNGNEKHGPRIKVQLTKTDKIQPDNWFSVTISDNPEITKKYTEKTKNIKNGEKLDIFKFILLNKEVLLNYWSGEISTSKMVQLIKPI